MSPTLLSYTSNYTFHGFVNITVVLTNLVIKGWGQTDEHGWSNNVCGPTMSADKSLAI